jgi:AraC-like DNA-binding protein
MSKNIAESSFKETNLENGFHILHFQNNDDVNVNFERNVESSFIQLHFCLKGNSNFKFNDDNYVFNILDKHCVLLYNPQQNLPIRLEMPPQGNLISILVSIKKLHSLFSKEANYIPFLSEENSNKKFYDDSIMKPSVLNVLQQMVNLRLDSRIRDLYMKGKIYELLSLHFQKDEISDGEYCPFLVDEGEILKIRKAKNIITSRISDPPSLNELSNEIGLSLKKLKEGFKQIYGDTVYSFLFDYKMEQARIMLESNQFNVNEVGSKIGYSMASHFIAAFKKKFGTTPKQYVLSLQSSQL